LLSSENPNEWTTILTRRPEGDWQPTTGDQHFEDITVEPLTSDDIRQLAIASSDEHLTDRQLDVVVEQAANAMPCASRRCLATDSAEPR